MNTETKIVKTHKYAEEELHDQTDEELKLVMDESKHTSSLIYLFFIILFVIFISYILIFKVI